jgi:hypothetical protein
MKAKINNLKNTGIVLVFIAMAILSSCEKDNNEPKLSPIVGTWETVNYEKKSGLAGTWAKVSDLSCRLDERQVYEKDGRFSQLFGPCAADNSTVQGTWKLSSDNSVVTYTYTKYKGDFSRKIEKLTDNELVISWDSGSTTGTYFRASYKKSK